MTIICRVIDNYGDAGFCLRLSRALAKRGHTVTLLTDNLSRFDQIRERPLTCGLIMLEPDSQSGLLGWAKSTSPKLVLECFGSSGDGDSPIQNSLLQTEWPNSSWLIVDYLSAEKWVEGFHGIESTNPRTGFKSRYFYPGFNQRTGGLIHCDAIVTEPAKELRTVFAFCYGRMHVDMLESALGSQLSNVECLTVPAEQRSVSDQNADSCIGMADKDGHYNEGTRPLHSVADSSNTMRSRKNSDLPSSIRRNIPFVDQLKFDAVLAQHDFLFVRGEDSFVRAQLAGRPLVWQIYAVEDQSHWVKLKAFFDLYSHDLSETASRALWALWTEWNQERPDSLRLQAAWKDTEDHFKELAAHAHVWRKQLLSGPELVSEILTATSELDLNQ